MPTAIYTDENGTDHEYEYTAPDNAAAPFAVDIVESRYIGADGVMALARAAYEGKERWVAYCPSDIPASHHSIAQAHAAGLLTGQLEPTPWVAPLEPTDKEKAIGEISGRDASGEDMRIIEDLADAIIALGGNIPQQAKARIEKRRSIRARIKG